MKHGVRLHLVNLYAEPLGNADPPEKYRQIAGAAPIASPIVKPKRMPSHEIGFVTMLLAALIAVGVCFSGGSRRHQHRPVPSQVLFLKFPKNRLRCFLPKTGAKDKSNAYLADGVQDEIITRLSKIADLKVISRTSTQHYKSAPENLPEIARQLGVATVLEGSVQRNGDAVRVNVQLIKAANDSHF